MRFGVFELDLETGELRRSGLTVRLQEQPFRILKLLLERPGKVVTQQEVINALWSDGTIVEYEHSVKAAVKKLRQALGDNADAPRYVETLPRRGYRFICPVGALGAALAPAPLRQSQTVPLQRWPLLAAGAFALLLVASAISLFRQREPSGLPYLKQRQLTTNTDDNPVSDAAISPDGKYLAYTDRKGIHVKLLATGETKTLPPPEALKGSEVDWGEPPPLWRFRRGLIWFPDSTELIATANVPDRRPSVWRMSVLGGAPRLLREDAQAWTISPDGASIAFSTNSGMYGDREIWLMGPNGEQARKFYETDENSRLTVIQWSPDGQRLAYGKEVHPTALPEKAERVFESRDLKGGPDVTILKSGPWWTNGGVLDLCWLPDSQLIYVVREELRPNGANCNFWELPIDPRTAEPRGKPRRLTDWAEFCQDNVTATADGKRLAFKKWGRQKSVYVAELEANGTRITTPTRLTLSEDLNEPYAWTSDSQAVIFTSNRNGKPGIFKQSLREDSAEPIVTGQGGKVSPDGAWVLYTDQSFDGADMKEIVQLMRVPVAGGASQLVLTAPVDNSLRCARPPASFCAFGERPRDRRQIIVTAFDPLQGRGHELTRFDTDPSAEYSWDLSPEGARIAMMKNGEPTIHMLWLNGHAPQEIALKSSGIENENLGWGFNWAADGKGIFLSGRRQGNSLLLHVDLRGNVHVLWEQKGTEPIWGIPSPDGRHLAMPVYTMNSNVWMMENF